MKRLALRWSAVCLGSLLMALDVFGQAASSPVHIAQYAGDRAAAISYTFDDALRDQYTLAVPYLNEVGFKGTFFVIPSYVASTVEEAEKKKDAKRAWGSITWDELREMARQGHEIGSHTWSHPGLPKLTPEQVDAELSKSYDAIKKEIGQPPLTLAYPFNQYTPAIEAAALKYYVACRDHQLGVGGSKTAESLNTWADQLVRDHQSGVVMAHAIGQGYAAFGDPEAFHAHLKYVKSHEKDIWVDTFANVSRYEKERDSAKVRVVAHAPKKVIFTVESALDPALYNVPLTLLLDAPGAASPKAERAGQPLPVRLAGGTIQIEAPPAKDPVTVTWQ